MARGLSLVLATAPATTRRLETTGRVEGTLHFENMTPAANLALALDGERVLLRSTTDDDGHFVFMDVPPGRYELYFAGPYYFGWNCGIAIPVSVRAGLTWQLSNRVPPVYPRAASGIR